MKTLFHISLALVLTLTIEVKSFQINHGDGDDSIYISLNNNLSSYSIPDSMIQKFPFQNQNNINRFYPGIVSYFQNFYIRGGENYETGFFVDGIKFNDLFTGKNSFFINPNNYEKIDFYNGFIPVDFGNTSSGLFNYKLKTGGEKLNFNIEHQTDNITFTNDAFSGNKRLGAYFYGYNETNLEFSGPLYFKNVRFFVSADYLFQRDKNPQRYPGADNLFFKDPAMSDSITIDLPAGIVPLNSFESANLLSTILLDFDNIKIKATGIYFDENEYTERNHILEYLNRRAGLIDKFGGILNLNVEHKVNNILTYSLNGSYYQKSERTTDQYLGADYWSYGDSVANAQAGVYFQEDRNFIARYVPPFKRYIFGFIFLPPGYPNIDFQKSEQSKVLLSAKLKLNLKNHLLIIGGEYSVHKLRYWQFSDQKSLAGYFAGLRLEQNLSNLNDIELKEFISKEQGANNFGYDPIGNESNSGLDKAPSPVFYSVYAEDQFNIFNNLYVYLGLRYDHFDYDYKKMINPGMPDETFEKYDLDINEEGLVQTEDYSYFLPKVNIRYFLFKNLLLFADYSKNAQVRPFSLIYEGFYSIRRKLVLGAYDPVVVGNVKPLVTSEFEIGVNYNPVMNLKGKLTYFHKRTNNLTTIESYVTFPSIIPNYYYYTDFRTNKVWGLEFQIDYYLKGFSSISNFSYQNASENTYYPGTRSRDMFTGGRIQLESSRINKIHINTLMSYDFYQLKNTSNVFNDMNFSFLFSFNSGHPYFNDYIYETRTTPNVYQVDIKLEKGFSIFNDLNIDLYLYVINLFDTKNEFNVFPRTGSAEDDGYISDPNLGGQLIEVYGEQYAVLYKLKNLYNPQGPTSDFQQIFYGPPRQIGFGIKVNY